MIKFELIFDHHRFWGGQPHMSGRAVLHKYTADLVTAHNTQHTPAAHRNSCRSTQHIDATVAHARTETIGGTTSTPSGESGGGEPQGCG